MVQFSRQTFGGEVGVDQDGALADQLNPKTLAYFLVMHGHWAKNVTPSRVPPRYVGLHLERIDSVEMGRVFKELQKLLPSLTADTFSRGPIRDSMLYASPEDLRRIRAATRDAASQSP